VKSRAILLCALNSIDLPKNGRKTGIIVESASLNPAKSRSRKHPHDAACRWPYMLRRRPLTAYQFPRCDHGSN
jgi:hypothetical protein